MAKTYTDQELKNNITKQMSYTNRDYETILTNIIKMFQGNNPISENWDNMSSSDPFFVILHLMAAHVDILNYQIDYQTLESFMSTARERASIVRNANSYGYKLPSYKAAKASFTFKDLTNLEDSVKIKPYEFSLKDERGFTWTYIGEPLTKDDLTTTTNPIIDMYQGIPLREQFNLSNVDMETYTKVIGNQKIAIGNNANNLGLSKLYIPNVEPEIIFKEVESLYTYTALSSEIKVGIEGDNVNVITNSDNNVYELNVDPQGITYFKISKKFDLGKYANDYTGIFYYLITEGAEVIQVNKLKGFIDSNNQPIEVELDAVPNSLNLGSNPVSVDSINENFANYYAGLETLVTVNDFKNFMYRQKIVPNISKVLVIDNSGNTGDFENSLYDDLRNNIKNFEKVIYATTLTDGVNVALTQKQIDDLKQELLDKRLGGSDVKINASEGLKDITKVDVSVKVVGLPNNETVLNGVKELISKVIDSKGIGSIVTASELYKVVLDSEYRPYFDTGMTITLVIGGVSKESVRLEYNEFASFEDIIGR